jgi:hypothetical protein
VTNPQLDARLAELETRLRRVEDQDAIQRLKARYGQLVDARYTRRGPRPRPEIEEIAQRISLLFSEDAVWDGGPGLGLCEGREAIRQRFLEPTLLFSWHFFLKPCIEVDGDTAQGTWDVLSPCTAADGTPMWMAGVEEDAYVRRDGAWLHQRMKLDLVFMVPYARGWARKPTPDVAS